MVAAGRKRLPCLVGGPDGARLTGLLLGCIKPRQYVGCVHFRTFQKTSFCRLRVSERKDWTVSLSGLSFVWVQTRAPVCPSAGGLPVSKETPFSHTPGSPSNSSGPTATGSWWMGRRCPVFHTAGSREAHRANGMCQAFKCHVCGPCWQAHAALHNKPVTDALTHWAFICHHCIQWPCVLLPAKTGTFSPKQARSSLFFFFFKAATQLG